MAGKDGIGWVIASFFLVANMAGAGFLALPQAIRNTGWLGVPMMAIFCVMVGYSGTRLGECWVILEERWPDHYRQPCRQPYREIIFRSLGRHGGTLANVSVVINLFGASTVVLALCGSFTSFLSSTLPSCAYVLIYGTLMIPLSWFGTPKDIWQAAVVAVVSTVVACSVVVGEIYINQMNNDVVTYPNPTASSFSLGFAAIIFSFGGASMFPTIQNDMTNRSEFWKSVSLAFTILLVLYVPVAVSGYDTFGAGVPDNILTSIGHDVFVTIAVAMELVNLITTYVCILNPLSLTLEEILSQPSSFGVRRVVLRSCVVLLEMLVIMIIPQFSTLLQIVGGSTVTLSSFVLPPLSYMYLVNDKSNDRWPQRELPLWERILLWELVILGCMGGVGATVSALTAVVQQGIGSSCFVNFS